MQRLRAAAAKGVDKRRVRRREQDIAKAATRTNLQAASKLSRLVDGRPEFVPQPPFVERLVDLLPQDQRHRLESGLADLVSGYARSLAPDRRVLLDRFRLADMARKVVGVGSVGTRCWIILLVGRDVDDRALVEFAEAYADRNERDHDALLRAVKDGRLQGESGI